jgi:hypothetical protein
MEIRTIAGRRATDRAGAVERLSLSLQTVTLYASPAQRPTSHFPARVGTEDKRDWYALDDLDAFAEIHRERTATTPQQAPDWLRDGDPDELLPATEFRRAAKLSQGTWKRYVQKSVPAWNAGRDGYLPKPDREEDYRGTGKIYSWARRRMVHWLDNRPGSRAGAGRKGGDLRPTIQDATDALRGAGGDMSHSELAQALGIELALAQFLLREARARLTAAEH